MYIKDGICYAGEPVPGMQISDAEVVSRGMMLITFSTGEKRLLDVTKLEGEVFKPLENQRVLRDFDIENGVLTWQNGEIDIATETVYALSYKYTPKNLM